MVKVSTISRSALEWSKDRSGEVPRAHRNYDPKFNPLAKQTEYARAVRGAKLDRMFAKPFLAAMPGHHDTVTSIAVDPSNLSQLVSGGCDGELIFWDAMHKHSRRAVNAHRHAIDGCVFTPDGVAVLTASRDRTVKLWDTDFSDVAAGAAMAPVAEYIGESPFTGIDHNWNAPQFATASDRVDVWDINRTKPLQRFAWGDDTVTAVSYNKVEPHLIGCVMQDRGICFYDTRSKMAHSKIVMEVASTCLSWSPMDPNALVVGCDDWNCYLFDLRVTGRPKTVFQGFIHPVTAVDFAPTGQQFVAGSQDCTVRIWNLNSHNSSNSAEMFHTKRMAKVSSVRWSLDNNFIFTGSEDAIVRVWKADASKPIRPFRGPEQHNFNYLRSLKSKHSSFEQVRRINNQRNTPKVIRKMQFRKRKIMRSEAVKEMSRKRRDDIKPLAAKKVISALK